MLDLHQAAYDGHPGWVQTCLDRGDDANQIDARGHTPLLWSCLRGLVGQQVNVASLLINAGANVNATVSPTGESCLQLACQSSNNELVELLLENGADPNLIADELSPLMFAIRCREVRAAKILIAHGADATYCLHGRSAADYAAYEGFHELAKQLRALPPREDGA